MCWRCQFSTLKDKPWVLQHLWIWMRDIQTPTHHVFATHLCEFFNPWKSAADNFTVAAHSWILGINMMCGSVTGWHHFQMLWKWENNFNSQLGPLNALCSATAVQYHHTLYRVKHSQLEVEPASLAQLPSLEHYWCLKLQISAGDWNNFIGWSQH